MTIVTLLLMCGCSPQPKKAEVKLPPHQPNAPPAVHRERIVHPAKNAGHTLSEAEKDKIFQGFERWLAARSVEQAGGIQAAGTERADDAPDRPVE